MTLFRVVIRREYTPAGLEVWPRRDGVNFEDWKSFRFGVDEQSVRDSYTPFTDYAKRYSDTMTEVEPVSVEEHEALKDNAHRAATYWGQRVCCNEAIQTFCVCRYQTTCPEHGVRCHGSHD